MASGSNVAIDDEVVKLQEQYYILATSSRADDRTRVLKQGETFAIFDRFGDIQPLGSGEQGLYDDGTRHLSRLELRFGGRRPLLLSSTVKRDNDLLTVDLTNPDLTRADAVALPRGQVHIARSKFLWQGTCHERFQVSNFGLQPAEGALLLLYEVDWADVFEVRGMKRLRRGERREPRIEPGGVTLSCLGLDRVLRRTRLLFDPPPAHVAANGARWDLTLAPHQTLSLLVSCVCERSAEGPGGATDGAAESATSRVVSGYDHAAQAASADLARRNGAAAISTSHEPMNQWLDQSASDLHMMTTDTPQGPFPYAGVPWFAAPFGRDAIITAFELLWLRPETARGVLRFLAATQARETIPEQDAQPGKILHEARRGEMAATGEVPFGRYYGSVDATPLYVMLAGAYYDRTADRALIEEIWPNLERALGWMQGDGDPDGDGFLEYQGDRGGGGGLVQQGWKDSHDSVFHADGALAEAPIALCEVQGYAFAAWRAAARLARALGRSDAEIGGYEQRARRLRQRFEEQFWCTEIGTYALALDGGKRRCAVRTSNAGHVLFAGIAGRARASRVARALLAEDSFSGFGVRTVAACEIRYNPMSYHNGSVWPHDTALIAAGLGRYGLREPVLQLLEGLYEASVHVDLHRLPELFCGFTRRPGEGPTLYPVACAPQSWAAGAVFMLVQAALGLGVDALRREVTVTSAPLPRWLKEVRVTDLDVGGTRLDLQFERHPHDVGVTVLRREGDAKVVVRK
jgi:glycogen debranching enzyme